MKKYFFAFCTFIFFAFTASAQCDSTINLKSSKQERVNDKDEVVKSENDVASISITKSKLIITKENGDNIIDSIINKKTCEWKTFLKEGKVTYEITVTGEDGTTNSAKAWVEAKAGKVTFWIEMGDRKIRAIVD